MSLPKIVGIKPILTQVLVEHLTAQEVSGLNNLIIDDKSDYGFHQAIVLGVGPGVKPAEVGFGVGDRVMLQGSHVPMPNYDGGREKSIVEIHSIKGVVVQEGLAVAA
jgi:co-chaperonin GroES (HSP10)